jgi:hypothetical protein
MTQRNRKGKLMEQKAEIVGFEGVPIRLFDSLNDETVCHIGKIKGEEAAYFHRPVSLEELETIVELLQKKKMRKHLSNGDIEKAQEFANRKFQQAN